MHVAVALIALLLAPLLAAVAGPASPAAAVEPAPIPSDLWDTNPDVAPGQSYVALEITSDSEPGAVSSYLYTKANAELLVQRSGGGIWTRVLATPIWDGRLHTADWSDFATGYYSSAWSFWSVCGEDPSAWVAIDEITWVAGEVASMTARFGQDCGAFAGSMHGKIHWSAGDTTQPPGPAAIPADLWDVTPPVAPGQTYLYVDGAPDDHLTTGADLLVTKADSVVTASAAGRTTSFEVEADRLWKAEFTSMSSVSAPTVGFYDPIEEERTNPVVATVDWTTGGQDCDDLGGWYAIDEVAVSAGVLQTLTMRFELRCGTGPAMRGKFHWEASDTTAPPPPPAPPDDLWDVQPDVAPGQSYAVVDSSAGGPDAQHLDTQATAVMSARTSRSGPTVSVTGDVPWQLQVTPPSPLPDLAPGTFLEVGSPANYNPTRVTLYFSGGCETAGGWIAVDEYTRSGTAITLMTVRFSVECEDGRSFRGKFHWDASDTTTPPPPQVPVPDGLWDAAPAVGPGQTYVLLESEVGDVVGKGAYHLYTKADSAITVQGPGKVLSVDVVGDEQWSGRFAAMVPLTTLQVGLYPMAGTYNASGGSGTGNPTRGQLRWDANPGVCGGPLMGWFAVDELTRSGTQVTSATIRFEQSCGGGPVLHGKVRWVASDTTPVPGPVIPIPEGLWDASPAVGPGQSYVVLSAPTGDRLTGGIDSTYTQATAKINVNEVAGSLKVSISGGRSWTGTFVPMSSVASLEPGYYPLANQAPGNPRRGAVSWLTSGATRSPCGTAKGWFAIDELGRSGGVVTSATIRFALSCDGTNTLNGKIRWNAADTTQPGAPELPVPAGLWDEKPPGVSGDYVYVQGAPGDPVTGGADDLFVPTGPGIPVADQLDSLATFWRSGNDPEDFWIAGFEGFGGLVGPGYYGDLSSETSNSPVLPGLALDHVVDHKVVPCPSPRTGWFAVDKITRIDGQISQLDLRFEQSCGGAPPLHGRIHSDLGGMPSGPPVGALESATPKVGGVDVKGWAIDPDTMGAVSVKLKVDGSTVATVSANGDRPDIGASHAPYGNAHGFASTVAVPAGTHQLCAVGVDIGNGAESVLGCQSVTVGSGSPFGSLDAVRAVAGGVQVGGWAIDPDTTEPIDVHVYVDGKGTALRADGARSDVATAHPGYGAGHGYGSTISTTPGAHQVCAYGINVGVGGNTLLGCRTVTVLSGSPTGSLDMARQGPSSVVVGGWAIDPDTTGSIPVHVYVDGKGTALTANGSRPDVGSLYPGYGSAHGFSATIPTTPGTHQVCAYGINSGAGGNTLLGCRTVTVPSGSPIGTIDVARGGPGWVSVGGWALDADSGDPIQVHVYVDTKGTAITANGARPDVGAYFFGWGDAHGYATTIAATPGVHSVCVYGINVGPGGNTLLGCRSVTVG